MKKICIILISISLLIGCSLGNTPTSRVEDYLYKYQTNNKTINTSYTNIIDNNNITKKQQEDLENIISKQYKNLVYEIKEEVINGDAATVTVEIEVKNFKNIINKYDKDNYNQTEYINRLINDMKTTKETVTYILGITLTKQANDSWKLDPLSIENRRKLLGIY